MKGAKTEGQGVTPDEEKEIIGSFMDWSLPVAMERGDVTYHDFLRVIRNHLDDRLQTEERPPPLTKEEFSYWKRKYPSLPVELSKC